MKCIIHIGTEKTGTTLLQKWLYGNRQTFLKNKIYLTEQFGIPNNWYFPFHFCKKYDGHFMKKNNIHSEADKELFFSNFSNKFDDEFRKAEGCKYFIITSEHFHSRLKNIDDIKNLRMFLTQYFTDIKIICYFREQSSMALSLHSTDLKGGGFANIDKFMKRARPENYYFNFLKIADNWSNIFGRKNCVFRIYDHRYFYNDDLRADFCNSLGLDINIFGNDGSKQKENLSLSALQSILLREVNESLLSPPRSLISEARRTTIKDKILLMDTLQKGSIHHKSQREVYEKFKLSNEEFLEKYFPNGESFRFEDKSPKSEKLFSETEVSNLLIESSRLLLSEIRDLSDYGEVHRNNTSRLSKWWEFLDYRLHRWVSENSWLPTQMRQRFIGATNRRRKNLSRKYDDFVS